MARRLRCRRAGRVQGHERREKEGGKKERLKETRKGEGEKQEAKQLKQPAARPRRAQHSSPGVLPCRRKRMIHRSALQKKSPQRAVLGLACALYRSIASTGSSITQARPSPAPHLSH